MARILLADDDKGLLGLVRRALELDGHVVTTAEDGAEALAALEAAGADLVVADVEMPGLDGIALARRALALKPPVRSVLMSAYPEWLETARPMVADGIRLVTKPFAIDAIRAEVKAALSG